MSARMDSEYPFFFGPDNALFGLYHPAPGPGSKAVLLCPPWGQEQIRCHRLYRQLACALAAEGCTVLRFDYYGTGDSAGSSVEVDWDRCIADTCAAADELRARSGAKQVVAFGARLGGSLALASATRARFADVVVWDPVVDGRAYIEQLDAMQVALRRDPRRFVAPREADDAGTQWLGFAVSPRLRHQLAELRPDTAGSPSLVLDSLPPTPAHRWKSLVAANAQVKELHPFTPWDDLRRLEQAILSHPLIQTVTRHWQGGL